MNNNKKIIFSILIVSVVLPMSVSSVCFSKTNIKITKSNSNGESLIVNNGSRDKKEVAITFDADMTYNMEKELDLKKVDSFYNENIIKVLEENSIPATFFLTGLWAEKYSAAAKEIAKNTLFEIGDHSYDHPAFKTPCFNLKKTSDKEDEIIKAQEVIKNITGVAPKFFRFPGGCFAKDDIDLAHKFGLEPVGWDVVSGDSYFKTNKQIINQTVGSTKNGSIIIMHLSGVKNISNTDVALLSIIKELKSKGFNFVKVSQLIADSSKASN